MILITDIDKFIVQLYEEHANFVGELDSLDIDPIFKWAIKKRLRRRYLTEGNIEPVYDIVKDFFEYHINSESSLGFKLDLFGYPTSALDILVEKLKRWLGQYFSLTYEEIVTERPHPLKRFICLTERGKEREDVFQELNEKESVIILELIAWHKDDNTLCRCLVHDMFHNRIGYVDIKCD